MFNENRQFIVRNFEVFLEAGLGTQTGQGADPIVMMRQSNDGGKTWLPERKKSAGKVGDYTKRVRYRQCGLSRDKVWEISMSDPIPWRLIDAFYNNDVPQQGGGA